MNWLAHVLLSESSPRCRVGNILPDVLGIQALAPLPAEYQRGVTSHHAIDAFTDEHPVFIRSRRRFHGSYRRFSGILVDVFYDYLLAAQWREHAGIPLGEFAAGFYHDLASVRNELPEAIHPLVDHLRQEDWLGSNASLDGPRGALQRVERRLGRRVDLSGAVAVFEDERGGLEQDFSAFFPDLVARVRVLGVNPPFLALPFGATGSAPRSA